MYSPVCIVVQIYTKKINKIITEAVVAAADISTIW